MAYLRESHKDQGSPRELGESFWRQPGQLLTLFLFSVCMASWLFSTCISPGLFIHEELRYLVLLHLFWSFHWSRRVQIRLTTLLMAKQLPLVHQRLIRNVAKMVALRDHRFEVLKHLHRDNLLRYVNSCL